MPERKQPERDSVTSTDPGEIQALVGRVRQSDRPERDALLVERLLRLVLTLVSLVEHKNASISRLKRLLFGPRSDKRSPAPPASKTEAAAASASDETSASVDANPPLPPKPAPTGH